MKAHSILLSFFVSLPLAAGESAPPHVFAVYSETSSIVGEDEHVSTMTRNLYLQRDDDTVIRRIDGVEPFEIWSRVGESVSLTLGYPSENRSVRCFDSDLRLSNTLSEWKKLSEFCQRSLMVEKGAGEKVLDRPTVKMVLAESTPINQLEVQWIEELGLPGTIDMRTGDKRFRSRLIEVHPAENPPEWAPHVSLDATRNLKEIDFADFGDLEDDPFVLKFLHRGRAANAPGQAHLHGPHTPATKFFLQRPGLSFANEARENADADQPEPESE